MKITVSQAGEGEEEIETEHTVEAVPRIGERLWLPVDRVVLVTGIVHDLEFDNKIILFVEKDD